MAELKGPQELIWFIRWSPDSTAIATGDSSGSLWVWNARAGSIEGRWDRGRFELVRRITLAGSSTDVRNLAWSPDGTQIAAGDAKGVQILDPQRDVPVRTLPDPADASYDNVDVVGWSADGTRLGTFTSYRRTARVWDVAKASRLQTFSVGLWRALTE